MSSPFRSAMAAFEELPALTDDDLRVLLRSLGTDQLRRVMGIGHSALLQMDAHYATRIQLRDQALALAKQTMASQRVAPPTAPLAPISKAKAAGRGIDQSPPVKVPGTTATVAKAKEPVVKPMPSAPPPASSPSTTAEVDQASTGAAPATSTQAAASTTPATGKAVGPMSKPDAPQPAPQAVAAAACAKAGAGTGAGGPPKTTSSTSTQPPPATTTVQQKRPTLVQRAGGVGRLHAGPRAHAGAAGDHGTTDSHARAAAAPDHGDLLRTTCQLRPRSSWRPVRSNL